MRSWRQKIKQHPFRLAILIGGGLLGFGLIVAFIGGYFFNWDWTGFSNKKLWDWLQPLIIPVGLAAGGYLFAFSISKNEQGIASDNQQQAALQAYFDKMSELLLHEHLGESPPPNEAVVIARARTATVLRILNPSRCASIIQFMSQVGILRLCVENSAKSSFDWPLKNEYSLAGIELPETNFNRVDLSMIHLEGANLYRAFLREANLEGTDLSRANLQRANLSHANLQKANLSGANLQGARLFGADLQGANLVGTDLEKANLFEAKISRQEQLEKVMSLKGAIMPDRSIHP
jgi:uncharacterized protein YjbI with pentapeptide repeats